MTTALHNQEFSNDRDLLANAATAMGLTGYWDVMPGVVPPREAFYVARESAGTMAWCDEWNPLRDDHTRYSLIRTLGLLTRNRLVLDKHVTRLRAQGMSDIDAVDRAIVCAAAELGQRTAQIPA